jgi:hypothetical protein
MTSPVTPPDVILPSAYPALGSPTFNQEAYNAATSLPVAFTRQGAIAAATKTNADSALESAQAAQQSVVDASAAAGQAISAANFKNLWSNLSGALNKPACVKHNGRFWLLLNNLANVAASEPGPSNPDWTANDAGVVPSQTLTTAGASVAAVTGVRYILAANNIALTAPTPTLKGEYHGIRRVAGVTGCTWIFGSNKVRGATPGTLAIDIQEQDLFYEDATQGMV